jgi:hypothetical protein
MFIEEKLDNLKQELTDKNLVIRYNDFKSIMSKIENHFLSNENLNHKYSGWIERLKNFNENNFEEETFQLLTSKLKDNQKYWWIFVDSPCYPNSRHRVFDATLLGGQRLSFIFSESPIYIVHKKYDWMIMLDRKQKLIKEKKRTHNNV